MSPDRPFALHITWTCYGKWLPGDERGHVSNTLLPGGGFVSKQCEPGTPYASGDALTLRNAKQLMLGEPAWLTQVQARTAARAVVETARKRRWRILRAAFMTNHVHVVIHDCPNDGPAVRRVIKGCSQAALCDLMNENRRWWTAGGSDRYKNDWQAIENAVEYVARQHGKLVEIVDMEVRDCECA